MQYYEIFDELVTNLTTAVTPDQDLAVALRNILAARSTVNAMKCAKTASWQQFLVYAKTMHPQFMDKLNGLIIGLSNCIQSYAETKTIDLPVLNDLLKTLIILRGPKLNEVHDYKCKYDACLPELAIDPSLDVIPETDGFQGRILRDYERKTKLKVSMDLTNLNFGQNSGSETNSPKTPVINQVAKIFK